MDGDKALPILKKVLARRDPASLCLRRKAVFLVSQHEGPETERILLDAARTDPDGEVREQAVQWLSQVDSPAAVAALDSILRSANDPALQDKAIFALSQQDSPRARQALKDFALRAGVSSDLRQKAIFWIGQGDDPDRSGFLKSLYGQLKDQESREKILFSMSADRWAGKSALAAADRRRRERGHRASQEGALLGGAVGYPGHRALHPLREDAEPGNEGAADLRLLPAGREGGGRQAVRYRQDRDRPGAQEEGDLLAGPVRRPAGAGFPRASSRRKPN